jgi:predicted acylesterase/phospholipase RssA
VLASSSVPTYFPVVDGKYVDGGVGAYSNPSYVAAYEEAIILADTWGWDAAVTTLISLGTGRDPKGLRPGESRTLRPWQRLGPVLGAFLQSADDQQVHLVEMFFKQLDFRRFQVDLEEPIGMDDPSMIPLLTDYGNRLGRKILNDEMDAAMQIKAFRPARRSGPSWARKPSSAGPPACQGASDRGWYSHLPSNCDQSLSWTMTSVAASRGCSKQIERRKR